MCLKQLYFSTLYAHSLTIAEVSKVRGKIWNTAFWYFRPAQFWFLYVFLTSLHFQRALLTEGSFCFLAPLCSPMDKTSSGLEDKLI